MSPRALAAKCPPPPNFNPAGTVTSAEWDVTPPPPLSTPPKRAYGKKADGQRYERAAQAHFSALCGESYIDSPWLAFTSVHVERTRWCQPDAVLFDFESGDITLVEFKLKHTARAWWQTRHLYAPVLQFLFPPDLWSLRICEVVHWLDPHTTFPERFSYAEHLRDVPPSGFGVHIWRRS